MTKISFPSPEPVQSASAAPAAIPPSTSAADAGEFGQWMDGLVSSARPRGPSLLASMVRAPAAFSNEVLTSLGKPAPVGMSLIQKMDFYAQKSIDVNIMKTTQNLVSATARLAKKNIETVLNNK